MNDADSYVVDALRDLEQRLGRMIGEVRNGIAEVEQPADQIVQSYDPNALPILQQQNQDINANR
ncbi:MAG: hypothetical protein HND48_07740 [Chloroflexi bacterium]|nr:hypothetical protein [Chloroflexota bacterium]